MQAEFAPEVFRQRLLVEGYYTRSIGKDEVVAYLTGLAAHLNLKAYSEPVVFAPASGMGREANSGFDAFLPLIDSGISLYVWTGSKFMSTVIYTCKGFDAEAALQFTRDYFALTQQQKMLSF